MRVTSDELEPIKTALMAGVTEVQYKDRLEKFRSLDDMLRTIRLFEPNFALKKKRFVRPVYSRGY